MAVAIGKNQVMLWIKQQHMVQRYLQNRQNAIKITILHIRKKTYDMNKATLSLLAALGLASCTCNQQDRLVSDVVEKVIMTRRSIRNYKPQPVSRDTMTRILKAGINAPNGKNRQAWEIRVVDNPEFINQINEAMAEANPDVPFAKNAFRGAPVIAFIAKDTTYDFSETDCGLLAENMILSAWSMGIGSVCLGSPVRFLDATEEIAAVPKVKEVMKRLNFSQGYKLSICIGFGYPNEEPAAKPRDESKYKFVD